MSQLKQMSHIDNTPSTPGKFKMEKSPYIHRLRFHSSLAKLTFWSFMFLGLILIFFFRSPSSSSSSSSPISSDLSRRSLRTHSWADPVWEKRVRSSARVRSHNGFTVLVTGAAGFVGTHVSAALKRRGDGVLGLDNFNDYYDPSLKRARQALLERSGIFIVEGDINDIDLLKKLFEIVSFSHVMHLAAQAGVRYAMENPSSYVHSNIAGLVSVLEVCKSVNPQPSIVWASSSSVYGLNTKVPFSEKDRTDQPASLYAATKKAGEEIAHTYNHIHGLSLTGLRFFTVYGPWGRPDMAYFFFTRDILKGKSIPIFEASNHGTVARDFTYIDDIVKGCLAALDTAEKSTGSGGKKKGPAQLRVFNLGNTSPVPVSDLVGILERLLKVKAKRMIMKLPRNGDVQFTHANISLAQKELGYKPTTDLQTGLKKFVRWYLSYYGSGKKSSQ
ncbi:UDP-glucuronate 4-epimerase 3 [Camellia lanceoleosa]|uniref:UDP-glucuronate 4-epimerase 3 n=1 Tax=Camellia lanceoleosa TaxID=1840588 RepID=A0ACC0IEE3_9ERIC|nr:UDP-glucuronate 4-epimerase 3 [Camellia lanceoleosa]